MAPAASRLCREFLELGLIHGPQQMSRSSPQVAALLETAGDHGRVSWMLATGAVIGYSYAICVAVAVCFTFHHFVRLFCPACQSHLDWNVICRWRAALRSHVITFTSVLCLVFLLGSDIPDSSLSTAVDHCSAGAVLLRAGRLNFFTCLF